MKISLRKIIVIFIVITVVLFEKQFVSPITRNMNSFCSRKVEEFEKEKIDRYGNKYYPEECGYQFDYISYDFSEKYIELFLDNLQNNDNINLNKYLVDGFYNMYNKYEDEDLKDVLNDNIKIKNSDNVHEIIKGTEYENEDGENITIFNVVITDGEHYYPRGYEILQENRDVDRDKSISIHLIEKGIYDVKIYKVIQK